MAKKNARWRREARQEAAKERQAVRDQRTPKQQIQRLDELLGDGEGAQKERARLLATIEAAKMEAKREKETKERKAQKKEEPNA